MDTADFILETLVVQGERLYGGEKVTQLEHALQSAALAEAEDAPAALVVAALLHDIGHLLPRLPPCHDGRGSRIHTGLHREAAWHDGL